MSRKSRNLDKKMLKVGGVLLKKKGVAGLSIREVARKAGVNLGMFNYYFEGKDHFVKEVLEEVYTPFIADLKTPQNHSQSLEEVLFKMAVFSRDHCHAILSVLTDVFMGERAVIRFLSRNFTDHFHILKDILKKYFEENGYDQKHIDHAFRYLISTVGLPNLLVGIEVRLKPTSKPSMDSDEYLKRRVQAAIGGLEFICGDR